jgi:hypothetical protein
VRVGDALLRVLGNVGRCALTTRQPDTGVVDFKTLHHLKAHRHQVPTTEPPPFGVHARVPQPGLVGSATASPLRDGACSALSCRPKSPAPMSRFPGGLGLPERESSRPASASGPAESAARESGSIGRLPASSAESSRLRSADSRSRASRSCSRISASFSAAPLLGRSHPT